MLERAGIELDLSAVGDYYSAGSNGIDITAAASRLHDRTDRADGWEIQVQQVQQGER
jgi:hypothetical protein